MVKWEKRKNLTKEKNSSKNFLIILIILAVVAFVLGVLYGLNNTFPLFSSTDCGDVPPLPTSCPKASLVIKGVEVYQQNILKGHLTKNYEGSTYERLRSQDINGEVNVRITETPGDITYLNSLSLVEIQIGKGKEAYLDLEGNAWQFEGSYEIEFSNEFDVEAEAIILKGSLKQNTVNNLREYWGEEVRVQCLPGIYGFADSLSKSVVKKIVEKEAGISMRAFVDGSWKSLNDGTLILEKSEEAFVVLPKGTEKIRISYPDDAYEFESLRIVKDIKSAKINVIESSIEKLQDVDNDYIVIVNNKPLDLTFNVDRDRTYYFKSHGYYHYFEDIKCESPSYRWDKVLGYLAGI